MKKMYNTKDSLVVTNPTTSLALNLAYLWESGRDPEFSRGYGRTWKTLSLCSAKFARDMRDAEMITCALSFNFARFDNGIPYMVSVIFR
ncbi:hypothetical protein F5B21DRAFT_203255 [Xylaria acuta]|nr:hypothetical protein F5B21DRAFT_203255 [Xylaria acuta]